MSFWGVEVKPGKPITHSCEKAKGRLRVSQATLGIGDATKKTVVQCNVGNRSPVLLCALLPGVMESCNLELEFAEADDVVFSVIGPRSVYLTGYYVAESRSSGPQSDSESYGVDIQNSHSEESDYHSDDDEYDDSFIDDGKLEVSPPSPDSGSNLDETGQESDKPKEKNGRRRQLKKKYQVVESDSDAKTPENENDDKYLFSFFKNKKDAKKDTLKTKEADAVNAAKAADRANVNGLCSNRLKEEAGAQVGNDKINREGESNQVKNKEEAVVSNDKLLTDNNINGKNADVQIDVGKQKRKRKECSKTEEKPCEVNIDENHTEEKSVQKSKKRKKGQHKVEGASKEGIVNLCHTVPTSDKPVRDLIHIDSGIKDLQKASSEEEQHTDKSEAERYQQLCLNSIKREPEKKTRKKSKKKTQTESKATYEMPANKRTLSNGLSIEVLANGPPDGKVAAPGKKVKLYYTAMIKETGHIFDSNVGKTALKCRLGDKESIDGWNLGIDGMRVGEKRRLVIPPSMGFRNHEENVPPESWLVYDVELVSVHK